MNEKPIDATPVLDGPVVPAPSGFAEKAKELLSNVVYGDLIRRRFLDVPFVALRLHF
jgi:hypothetical protein